MATITFIIKFIFSICCVGHRLSSQEAGILVITTFKIKRPRHESYPNRPPPRFETSILPLSRTDTLSVFSVHSQDTCIQQCSAHLNSHHTSCSFPFPFISLLCIALVLPTGVISSHLCGCTHINTPVQP